LSGIGFTELVVLFVIGLLILGPERLPRVATQIGRWVGRARRTANQLRYQLEREIALADIEKKTKDREEKKQQDSGANVSTGDATETESTEPESPTTGGDEAQASDDASGQSDAAPDDAERPAQ
jgi:sec-independent protein translocase protein TatB